MNHRRLSRLVYWLSSGMLALFCWSRVWSQAVDQPMTGLEAANSMIVPDGFQVSLFASEPDVKQPIGFCIDDRGRLWIAEAYNYPNHGTRPGDRIVILEDTDHDGRFDQRKVFYDQLNYVTGIEVGFGGAWVMSPPYFYFIPDRDRNDIPDGEPKVLLDGFGNHANAHNLANGFAWGPDGWLYGTHGRTNWSLIGKPGTPDAERIQYDGGVYRYHPVRHVWEPFSDGTTNPWGIDWDDFGEAFVCNCVNPHLFHVIPGAHYEPWRNRESSRHAYQRIDTIADHLHFVGQDNVRDGLGSPEEDAIGGGHAHCGTMVYLGDNWPEKYRNSVFMNNIHGKRINHDWLSRKGSGYTASHAPDILRSRDPWHVGVTLQYGPDGGVYVLDWSDTGECHHTKNTQRETGRVFKITYGKTASVNIDMASLSNRELVQLQLHRNDWYVRHARRLLHERVANGDDMSQVRSELHAIYSQNEDVTRKLRALWCWWTIGGLEEAFLRQQLDDPSEHIRAWSIRLLCETTPKKATLDRFEQLAKDDSSAKVRLYLAAMLQRLPHRDRWNIATALVRHAEDANDPNIPLLLWYGMEPLVDDNLDRFVRLASESKLVKLQNFIARRVASHDRFDQGIDGLLTLIDARDEPEFSSRSLEGILVGLEGRRSVAMPSRWTSVSGRLQASSSPSVRQSAIELALLFDDPKAMELLRARVLDKTLENRIRQQSMASLIEKKARVAPELLLSMLDDPTLRKLAVQGLAEFDHPNTVTQLLRRFDTFDGPIQQDVMQTLASRATWGNALLDAMEANRIPRRAMTAYTARQMQSLGDADLDKRLTEIWGELRSTPVETAEKLVKYKKLLSTSALKKADLEAGRRLFDKNCGNCHRLFDSGQPIGPDLTGSQRTNFDYLLENILDPSASVAKDFQIESLLLEGGRVISGLVVDESDRVLSLQTVNEKIAIPKNEIEERRQSQVSLMPDGILNPLSNSQMIDLIGYLSSPKQVPLATPLPK